MKKFSEIIEEIRKIKNLKSEAKVAELFGLLPQALNRYKRQNLIPFDLYFKAGIRSYPRTRRK